MGGQFGLGHWMILGSSSLTASQQMGRYITPIEVHPACLTNSANCFWASLDRGTADHFAVNGFKFAFEAVGQQGWHWRFASVRR